MTPSLQAILESKRKLRRELASRQVAEKLRLLDAMRERQSAIHTSLFDLDERLKKTDGAAGRRGAKR